MQNSSNFLDFWDIFANELIGDPMVFILLSLVLLWYLSIRARMPYQLSILFGILLLAVFFAETNFLIIWVFIVLIVGLMFYYAINKAMK